MTISESDPSVEQPLQHVKRTGRPYDRSGDSSILMSTLDLLAERDYERVTVDEVAARVSKAKTTVYRRWATKEDLVLAAIRGAGRPPEAVCLPDLGCLRSDLIAVIDSPWLGGTVRRLSIFAGLASAVRTSERLADVIRTEVTEPYVEIYRRLLDRAVARGEISSSLTARIPVLAEVIPAMSSHRLTISREPIRREYFVAIVDDVVLPAVGTNSPVLECSSPG